MSGLVDPKTPPFCTSVLIVYRKNRINHRLRFGDPHMMVRLSWHRKAAVFLPGSVFGYIHWRGNQYGTQDWQLFVCRSAQTPRMTRIPGVYPGAELLLHTRGSTRTKRVLKLIDSLEAHHGSLENVQISYWSMLHNWLQVGMDARALLPPWESKRAVIL